MEAALWMLSFQKVSGCMFFMPVDHRHGSALSLYLYFSL